MREAEPDCVDDTAPLQIIRSGKSPSRAQCQFVTAWLRRHAGSHRLGGIFRERHVLQAFGDPDVVLVGHAAHAGPQRPHEVQAGLDQRVHRRRFRAV